MARRSEQLAAADSEFMPDQLSERSSESAVEIAGHPLDHPRSERRSDLHAEIHRFHIEVSDAPTH